MEEILDLAGRLGKRIAENPRAQALASARKALENNTEQQKLLADYEQLQRRIGERQAGGQPIEPEDKRNLASLHEQVVASELIKALLACQADYIELMTQVSRKIEQEALKIADGSTAP